MKKTISFISILLVVVLFTTGCGTSSILAPEEKNLTCNYVLDEDGYTVEQDVVIRFEDDKATNLKMDTSLSFDEDMSEYTDYIVNQFEDSFEQYDLGEDRGSTVDVYTEGGATVLSINVDFKKISSSDRSSLGLEDDSTYDQMKETFESQNYTCK